MRGPGETNGSCTPCRRTSLWEGAEGIRGHRRAGETRESGNLVRRPGGKTSYRERARVIPELQVWMPRAG